MITEKMMEKITSPDKLHLGSSDGFFHKKCMMMQDREKRIRLISNGVVTPELNKLPSVRPYRQPSRIVKRCPLLLSHKTLSHSIVVYDNNYKIFSPKPTLLFVLLQLQEIH